MINLDKVKKNETSELHKTSLSLPVFTHVASYHNAAMLFLLAYLNPSWYIMANAVIKMEMDCGNEGRF